VRIEDYAETMPGHRVLSPGRQECAQHRRRSAGAYEGPAFGGRHSSRTAPRMFTWVREAPKRSWCGPGRTGDKLARMASAPDRFFTTPHYDGMFRGVVTDSWRVRAPRALVRAWDAAPP
jgi:hypothetical protein